jgi:hypothetical protein
MATSNPQGLVARGNIDLTQRPQVKNADGTISTVRSMSFEEDGQEVLVPTVSPDGRILSDDEAIAQYHATGQFLGKFASADAADSYAQALHEQQAAFYGPGSLMLPRSLMDLPESDVRSAYLSALRSQGRWVTAPDESGLVLYDGNAAVVRHADGTPYLVKWDDLIAGDRALRHVGRLDYLRSLRGQ